MQELIPQYGGIPLIHKVGHAPIKATLRNDKDIIFGGEISGHFFWVENYFKIDDALYSSAKLLSLISSKDKPFSDWFTEIPQTSMTPEIKLPCADEVKVKVVEDVKKFFSEKYKVDTTDGARIVFPGRSFALVRPSNTAPYLTIRVEAESDARVVEIKNLLADQLEKYPEIGDKLDRKNVTSHTGKLGWV